MNQLAGKVIFLTGGASGIGEACVAAYAKAGAQVFVMDHNATGLQALMARLGDAHGHFAGNVSDAANVQDAIETCHRRYGKLDVIHNNAGIAAPAKRLEDTSEAEWDALMNVNLKSILWTTRFGIDALRVTRGVILNTSSLVGEIGQTMHAAYVATKGGLNALTKAMALDYAADGVRVNAVCPAAVWTPLLREWAVQQPDPDATRASLGALHALGYCPDGDVIADACTFLISDAARFITGCILPVGGGAELGYRR